MSEFQGFPAGLVPFLMQLAANNNRDWFKANEKRYEALVRGPSLAFVRAMREPLSVLAPHLVADDRKVGGSLMRLFRDTRFSKDKTPYKTNVGIQFRHDAGKDVHAPGIYLHISPEETFIGFGLWQPEPETLHRLRTAVAEKWDRWSGILGAPGLAGFEQFSEGLKRVPRGFPADHPGAAELRRTSFLASAPVEWEDLESPDAPARLCRRLEPSREYMAFLCEALSLPY
ncbi:TIGR02453 family protein [Myxococcota bacterium]|nr:TIGR02453 family protein [Myxococcota bacterium]